MLAVNDTSGEARRHCQSHRTCSEAGGARAAVAGAASGAILQSAQLPLPLPPPLRSSSRSSEPSPSRDRVSRQRQGELRLHGHLHVHAQPRPIQGRLRGRELAAPVPAAGRTAAAEGRGERRGRQRWQRGGRGQDRAGSARLPHVAQRLPQGGGRRRHGHGHRSASRARARHPPRRARPGTLAKEAGASSTNTLNGKTTPV